MDNAQKAIMIGVGLFITIIVIAAVMLITGIGQDLLNSGTEQLSGVTSTLDQSIVDQIDDNVGKTLNRSTAMSLARQILSLGGNCKVGTNDLTETNVSTLFVTGKKYTISGSFSGGIVFTAS